MSLVKSEGYRLCMFRDAILCLKNKNAVYKVILIFKKRRKKERENAVCPRSLYSLFTKIMLKEPKYKEKGCG